MPAGRPKKKLSNLPKGWKENLLALSEDGVSEVELRLALGGICHETWERLLAEEPEFSETINKCRANIEKWWNEKGRGMVKGDAGNATVWIFNMKNRFGWRDKTELSGDPDNPVNVNTTIRVEFVDGPAES